jgi:hypothetical protein
MDRRIGNGKADVLSDGRRQGKRMGIGVPGLVGSNQILRVRLLRRWAPRNDVRAAGKCDLGSFWRWPGGDDAKQSQFAVDRIGANGCHGREL